MKNLLLCISRRLRPSCSRLNLAAMLLALGVLWPCSGCGEADSQSAQSGSAKSGTEKGTAEQAKAGAKTPKTEPAGDQKKQTTAQEKKKFQWSDLLKAAGSHLAKHEVDEAQKILKQVKAAKAELSGDERRQLTTLEEQLEQQRKVVEKEQRDSLLVNARQLLADGKLEKASSELTNLLTNNPTAEQQQQARVIQEKIEEHRQARRKLKVGMELLESPERGRIKEGQNILWADPDVAFGMLAEALESDNTVLVANALEMLRKLNQPTRTLPAMIGILSRSEQAASWPAAIKEIQKVEQPGAGTPLLKLALSAKKPEQTVAALNCLAGIVDPPAESIVALLPKIYQDGADLPAVLAAAYHSLIVNHQQDLGSRRGLDVELTPEQEQQLSGLPERLQAIVERSKTDAAAKDAGWGAKRLAVLTRQMDPEPLKDVKIVRFTAEMPEAPAAGVLDGVWNSIDVKTMWRHPSKGLTTIVLDLGSERTVTGIRVWNYNEPGVMHRGWKDAEVFVSNSLSPTTPVATGTIPQAPGVANPPDYGTTLLVPFARGRYVKLQMLNIWRDDVMAGLSEIQIFGY